ICTDFPTCQGHWLPPLDIAGAFELHDENVQNYLGGFLGNDARVTIHWLHRLGALVTTLFILFLAFRLFSSEHRGFAGWLLLVLVVQVSLGISNVVFSLPLAVAVAHNGVAALLLLTMVTLVHTLGRQRATS
ncbi:MAG: COX15/CtaA family protein, partial [Gammaproteobacteria bacterium]